MPKALAQYQFVQSRKVGCRVGSGSPSDSEGLKPEVLAPDRTRYPTSKEKLLQRDEGLGAMARIIHYMPKRAAGRERWVGALQRTSVPLRLIDGASDPVSGGHMVARYRELFIAVRAADQCAVAT